MEYRGTEYLRKKLNGKSTRVKTRYKYYEMKNVAFDFGISTPPDLRAWNSTIGWCSKAVDSLADRLEFRGFKDDYFDLAAIFRMNNPDVLFYSAILGALISSCDFIYISEDEDGYPRLQVIDGGNATGIIDPITGLLNEGYAVLKRGDRDEAEIEAYFTRERTQIIETGKVVKSIPNKAPYPLLVPVVYRPDAVRPFGHSRISRACMSLVGSALRTIKRSEISAEFYSYPQKYVLGTDPDMDPIDKWKATMSSMLEFTLDENGHMPSVGQFSQTSMEPHMTQLRMFASLFAGEAGLTLDDLGFPQDNPSSAEAIKASHETLRLTARKAQRTFGSCFLNAGYLAACVRDNYKYERRQLYQTKPQWMPIFEPDAAGLASTGDGVLKLNEAAPGFIDREILVELTGLEGGEIIQTNGQGSSEEDTE